MKIRTLISFVLFTALVVPEANAAWVWTPQSRRWVNPKYAAKDSPQAQMEWAQGFFEQKDYPRAAKEYLRLVQAYSRSELAPEAQYLAGLSYELADNPEEAFGAYKKLVEIYPFSKRFKDAIEREFFIAESLRGGKRLKLVGPVSLPSLDKAVEIYQHILEQAPYSDYGDKAQFQLGECYILQKRFEEANRTFQRMLTDYPASALVDEAKYRVAFCARQLSLKPSYDQSATDEAIEWYEEFIKSHPESSLLSQAQESLRQLKGFKAQGLAKVAQFYEKQHKPASAAIYYRQIVENYPDSSEAAEAAGRLTEFEREGIVKKQ